MENSTPSNPSGKIVKISTKEDCLNYLTESNLRLLDEAISGGQKITDFLPFYVEALDMDTFTVSTDLVYSGVPQIINCQNLVFNGGSITSYVQLTINAKTTTLTKLSPVNNYQVKLVGSTGNSGPTGPAGSAGPNGKNGQSKSCDNADAGSPGGTGNPGTNGGDGSNGGGTPVSNLNFGTIVLEGTSLLTVIAQGGSGGNGGNGGQGGSGGSGGNGGNSTSTGCTCYTNGGDGGQGGTGGQGGKGGNAGNGSSTNQGMAITVASQADKGYLSANPIAGSSGSYGSGGAGGAGGSGGSGGTGTKHGHDGANGSVGTTGSVGGNGSGGSNGTLPQITVSLS